MDFNEYLAGAETTAQFPTTRGTTDELGIDPYVLSSLLTEVGDVSFAAGRIKKAIRGDKDLTEVQDSIADSRNWPTVKDAGSNPKHGIVDMGVLYALLGLVNEAGEVLDKLSPTVGGMLSAEGTVEGLQDELKGELGDVLWYWVIACKQLGLDPNEVAQANLDKLASRKERGVIKGDGDHR